MSRKESSLDIVQNAYQSFNQGDIPAVLDILDEDVAWIEMDGFPYRGTHRGPDAVLENVFTKIGDEWETWQAAPEEFIDAGDTIVTLGLYTGTYKRTGRAMRAPFAHVWKMREGKVQKFRQYTDTVLVRRAMEGATAKKAA